MIDEKGLNQKQIRNIVVGLGLGLALTALFRYAYSNFTGTNYSELKGKEWKTVKLGTPFIQIETPVDLKEITQELPEKAKEYMESQQSFSYQAGYDLTITATIIKYHPDVYFDPEGSEKSVKNFEKLLGAKNIMFAKKDLTIDNYKSKRLDGSFDIDNKQYAFSRVSIESGQIVRDVLVIVKKGDNEGQEIKERIVQSIKVE
ncbi:MAG TPA: hypothetical protein VGK59_04380 [Ohtaekwangia sp.]